MLLFFKFIHSIKLRATWLRTHDFGRDDFRATWPVTFSYIFFKRLSCCRLNANFMLQMLKKLNCLWFAKKWILFPSNFCLAWLTWWLAWLAWLTGLTHMTRWLAGSQFVKTPILPLDVSKVHPQGAKKVGFTACHSGKLLLVCTGPRVF